MRRPAWVVVSGTGPEASRWRAASRKRKVSMGEREEVSSQAPPHAVMKAAWKVDEGALVRR